MVKAAASSLAAWAGPAPTGRQPSGPTGAMAAASWTVAGHRPRRPCWPLSSMLPIQGLRLPLHELRLLGLLRTLRPLRPLGLLTLLRPLGPPRPPRPLIPRAPLVPPSRDAVPLRCHADVRLCGGVALRLCCGAALLPCHCVGEPPRGRRRALTVAGHRVTTGGRGNGRRVRYRAPTADEHRVSAGGRGDVGCGRRRAPNDAAPEARGGAAVRLCDCAAVLLRCCAAALLCCCAAVLLCCCAAAELLCGCARLHCCAAAPNEPRSGPAVLLCSRVAVPRHRCAEWWLCSGAAYRLCRGAAVLPCGCDAPALGQ
jgi:hypothetical protein